MQEEINQLRNDIDSLRAQLASHNSIVIPAENNPVEFGNLFGVIKTVTAAADLTKRTNGRPNTVSDQIFIDTTTGTKKLYIYDTAGNVWRSCTIA